MRPGDAAWRVAIDRAKAFVSELRPEIVLAPWRRDPHRDHRDSFALTLEAIATMEQRPRLLEYAIWLDEFGAPEDRPRADEVDVISIDITPWRALKLNAIREHRSQLGRIVDDNPLGFALTEATVQRLTARHEIYFEAHQCAG